MYLRKLSLTHFKTYGDLTVEFSPKLNCFVGNNGVGKTNLFDSIYYLSFCKSYFNSSDGDIIKHSEDFFLIDGEFVFEDRTERIQCAFKPDQKKKIRRNDKEYPRLADHIGLIPLVMVSPADGSLIMDGSEERRRYMNSVISQYDRQYLEDLIQYNKALAQRNRILKEFSRNQHFDDDLLVMWDEKMADIGNRIYGRRKEFVTNLMPIFQNYYSTISCGNESVGLKYLSQLDDGDTLSLLRESRIRDRTLQYTTCGIHRDDLILQLAGYPIKTQGSQGQQKTYLVSLKMAQFDFLKRVAGVRPIILLDDVFDKLDAERVTQIIRLVAADHFGQIFITDKDQQHLNSILSSIPVDFKLFRVTPGAIKQQE